MDIPFAGFDTGRRHTARRPLEHSSAMTAQAFDTLIAEGPLSVAFQPILSVGGGKIIGFEVLGRCGALRGPLTPCSFDTLTLLDAAHACGRLLALDRCWRSIAVRAIAASHDTESLFFINLDPRVVEDPNYVPGFTRALVDRARLDRGRFVLEVTEHGSPDRTAVEEVLRTYRAHGFKIAVDDLGAPKQALGLVVSLRPDYVKIDRHLVTGADEDPVKQALLRSFASFASDTGMSIVAEGVETEGDLCAVWEAGITHAQGFALGHPWPDMRALSPRAVQVLRSAQGRVAGRRAASPGTDEMGPLLRLMDAVAASGPIEPLLYHVTAFAAEFLGSERVSLRLLDESRTRLLVAARAGSSLHASAFIDFAVGEGLVGAVVASGGTVRVGNAQLDARFVPKPGMREPVGSFLGVPVLHEDGCIGVLATTSPKLDAFGSDDERKLRLIAGVVAQRLQNARLRRLAHTDALTGAFNRHALDEVLAVDPSPPVAIATVDIDRFKSINDQLGHGAGDAVLRAVVDTMRGVLREGDCVVRVGGEEFLLVLPGASVDDAATVGERVRYSVERCDPGQGAKVTISIGVTGLRPGEPREQAIRRADKALYEAKEAGRNRVVCVE